MYPAEKTCEESNTVGAFERLKVLRGKRVTGRDGKTETDAMFNNVEVLL